MYLQYLYFFMLKIDTIKIKIRTKNVALFSLASAQHPLFRWTRAQRLPTPNLTFVRNPNRSIHAHSAPMANSAIQPIRSFSRSFTAVFHFARFRCSDSAYAPWSPEGKINSVTIYYDKQSQWDSFVNPSEWIRSGRFLRAFYLFPRAVSPLGKVQKPTESIECKCETGETPRDGW